VRAGALRCARAVLSDRGALRTVAVHLVALTFGAVALGLAFSMRAVGVQIETIAFVVVLGALAWFGRRRGPLGPIADHRSARGSERGSGHGRRPGGMVGPMLLAGSVRARPGWALVGVAATIILGLAIGTALRWPSQQAVCGPWPPASRPAC
jgi:hypothetical protein